MALSFLHPGPAQIGRYRLAYRSTTVERRLYLNDPHFYSGTSFNIACAADAIPHPAVLFVPTSYLPAGITRDFEQAGKRFIDDLNRHFSIVGFCDELESGDYRVDGFIPEMAEDSHAVAALTAGLDNLRDKAMFVNRRFINSQPMPDILFSEPMSWLLGRMVVNSHLAVNGQAPSALTAAAKDYYATKYQLAFKQSSFEALIRTARAMLDGQWPLEATGLGANLINDLRKIEAQKAQLEESLTSSDRLLLTVLEM